LQQPLISIHNFDFEEPLNEPAEKSSSNKSDDKELAKQTRNL